MEIKIKNKVNELIEYLYTLPKEYIKKEYNKAKLNDFENFEETYLYKEFDLLYSHLGYELELYDDLLNNDIYSTSDLIDEYIKEIETESSITNLYNVNLITTSDSKYKDCSLLDFLCLTDLYCEIVDENKNIKATDFKYITDDLILNDIEPLTSDKYDLNLRVNNGYIYSQRIKEKCKIDTTQSIENNI